MYLTAVILVHSSFALQARNLMLTNQRSLRNFAFQRTTSEEDQCKILDLVSVIHCINLFLADEMIGT